MQTGKKEMTALFGWMLFDLVELASERKPYEQETARGRLVIHKHTTSAGVTRYNVYYFKKSLARRLFERLTRKF
jgi:hypothetical protein